MIGSRRVHLHDAMLSIGWRANSKDERHEKEGQEEIKGNLKPAKTGNRKRPPRRRPLYLMTQQPGTHNVLAYDLAKACGLRCASTGLSNRQARANGDKQS